MVSCFACGSSATKKNKASGMTFHRFPSNPIRRLRWIKQLNVNRVPSENSVLCSLHFTKECFKIRTDKVHLKESAVPSIQVNRLKHVSIKFALLCCYTTITNRNINVMPTPINIMVHQPSTSLVSDQNYATNTSEVIVDATLVKSSTPGTSSSSQSYPVQSDDSPRKVALKRTIMDLVSSHTMKSKKIRLLQQANWRQRKKITSLKSIILELRSKNLILEEQGATLINSFGENKDFIHRLFKKNYLRKFSITLHFFSPKAYTYVRNRFSNCLPHPKTLGKWYSSINSGAKFDQKCVIFFSERTTK
ncbi:hypothetical protein RI129_011155 [Pyrocoelia pectoralis]|uniref:THAP-type domain-containing protein n=1 Tax=Pyrocoelia pectoralis TaxID=417401 RepID=A0AAN7V5R0_9COLE